MVQGTSPAPPCPSLGRRGDGNYRPYHPSFVGQGAWLSWPLTRPRRPQAQLLHKNNRAPAPGVGVASGKGPRYGYRGSNPPTTSWGAGEVPSFPVPVILGVGGTRGSLPPLRKRKCLCAHGAGRRVEKVGSHFRRPLALRSPASRLGLPSSVDDVVGCVWPQRAISACSPTEAATASSQPFISSWREK